MCVIYLIKLYIQIYASSTYMAHLSDLVKGGVPDSTRGNTKSKKAIISVVGRTPAG